MNNVKNIWSGIRSIINISKAKADYIPSILESGKAVDNPCAIANIFDNFFVNVGKNTDKNIPCGNCCPTSFLKGNFPDSMFLFLVTSVEVVDTYISQMDNNKSIGPYSIPVPISSKWSPLFETTRFCSVSSSWAICRESKQHARLASELSGYFS